MTVPEQHNVMGAFGAALIAKRRGVTESSMRPLDEIRASDFRPETFVCPHCANACEIVRFVESGAVIAHLGGRCERWSAKRTEAVVAAR